MKKRHGDLFMNLWTVTNMAAIIVGIVYVWPHFERPIPSLYFFEVSISSLCTHLIGKNRE